MSLLTSFGKYFDFGTPKRLEKHFSPHLKAEMPNSLASLLPYRSFIEGSNIFVNQNSYGFIVETLPLCGATESTSKILASMITQGFPKNTAIQVMTFASPCIDSALTRWSSYRKGEAFKALAQKRHFYLENGAHQSFLKGTSYLLRDFRSFIAVSLPGVPSDLNIQKMENLSSSLLTTLKTMQGAAYIVEPNTFLSFMDQIINPGKKTKPFASEWNSFDPLNLQMTSPDTNVCVGEQSIEFEDVQISTLSVRKFPANFAQWQMGDLIGDAFNDQLQIPCPFLSVLTIIIDDQEKAKAKATLKFSRAAKQNTEGASRFIPMLENQERDWRFAMKCLDSGEKLVSAHYQVLLFADKADAFSAESAVSALYEAKGWSLVKEPFIQLQSYLAALPFMPSEGLAKDMKKLGRFKTLLSSNCANLSPIQGEWKGMSVPRLLLTGRRGQPLFWDPFDNDEGNYNVAIVGKSGSGKSVFVQEVCASLLGSDARVFVIDKGQSFKHLAKFLEGTYLEFKQESKLSINPFSNIRGDEHFKECLKLLKPLIREMAKPTEGTSDWENAAIERAIRSCWDSYKNKTTITDIAEYLKEQEDERSTDLGEMLYPYTRHGSYGHFFDGEANVDLDNDFVVLELEDLQGQQDLQSVVMMVLMFQVNQAMYMGGRERHIACIIDEAWELMGGSQASAVFMEKGYRQARKYGCCYITCTQSIGDYHKTQAATAALENSDWIILLSQKKESIDALKQTGRISMTQGMERSLKSLKTNQDVYSECMIYGPQGYSVARLLLDKYSLALYTSKAKDFAHIESLLKQDIPIAKALEIHVQSKGYQH